MSILIKKDKNMFWIEYVNFILSRCIDEMGVILEWCEY